MTGNQERLILAALRGRGIIGLDPVVTESLAAHRVAHAIMEARDDRARQRQWFAIGAQGHLSMTRTAGGTKIHGIATRWSARAARRSSGSRIATATGRSAGCRRRRHRRA